MAQPNNELVDAAERLLDTRHDAEEAIRLISVRQNNPRVSASDPRRSFGRYSAGSSRPVKGLVPQPIPW